MTDTLTDSFDRKINYLRVSLTDQCNERCLYCRPNAYRGWTPRPEHLSTTELIQVITTAVQMGFEHIRLTGGEPLLRPDILEITRSIRNLPGLASFSLSTNGTLLAPIARQLQGAGIQSINLSLDALQPDIYRKITGGVPLQICLGGRGGGALLRALREGDTPQRSEPPYPRQPLCGQAAGRGRRRARPPHR
ncbi:MAG: radical SAM protein, partial [Verrucomicrobia bacterium]|nr:radical SAM protein [Verrucomicrobiota bacterium]